MVTHICAHMSVWLENHMVDFIYVSICLSRKIPHCSFPDVKQGLNITSRDPVGLISFLDMFYAVMTQARGDEDDRQDRQVWHALQGPSHHRSDVAE